MSAMPCGQRMKVVLQMLLIVLVLMRVIVSLLCVAYEAQLNPQPQLGSMRTLQLVPCARRLSFMNANGHVVRGWQAQSVVPART